MFAMPVRGLLKSECDRERCTFAEGWTYHLQADRQAIAGKAARDCDCRQTKTIERTDIASRGTVGLIDYLADQRRRLAHGRQQQNVHLLEGAPDIAARLANLFEGLDIALR